MTYYERKARAYAEGYLGELDLAHWEEAVQELATDGIRLNDVEVKEAIR